MRLSYAGRGQVVRGGRPGEAVAQQPAVRYTGGRARRVDRGDLGRAREVARVEAEASVQRGLVLKV